jgi:hypothetical protein
MSLNIHAAILGLLSAASRPASVRLQEAFGSRMARGNPDMLKRNSASRILSAAKPSGL